MSDWTKLSRPHLQKPGKNADCIHILPFHFNKTAIARLVGLDYFITHDQHVHKPSANVSLLIDIFSVVLGWGSCSISLKPLSGSPFHAMKDIETSNSQKMSYVLQGHGGEPIKAFYAIYSTNVSIPLPRRKKLSFRNSGTASLQNPDNNKQLDTQMTKENA